MKIEGVCFVGPVTIESSEVIEFKDCDFRSDEDGNGGLTIVDLAASEKPNRTFTDNRSRVERGQAVDSRN
jgi:hypothetical protein